MLSIFKLPFSLAFFLSAVLSDTYYVNKNNMPIKLIYWFNTKCVLYIFMTQITAQDVLKFYLQYKGSKGKIKRGNIKIPYSP